MTDATLFIDATSHHFDEDRLFGAAPGGKYTGHDVRLIWAHLRDSLAARGIRAHTADLLLGGQVAPTDRNAYISFGIRSRYEAIAARGDTVLSGFFARECPAVEPKLYRDLHELSFVFERMYSFSTTAALRPYLTSDVTFRPFRVPQPHAGVADVWSRSDRKFMALVSTNKVARVKRDELYTERLRALEYFHRHAEIDLFGLGWDGPAYRMGETRVPATVRRRARGARVQWERVRPPRDPLRRAAREAWRGPTATGVDTLGGYTFSLCFENMKLEGWVTERIFDSLRAGTIPVYLGAPDIASWVPRDCFVDARHFSDYRELRSYLHSLSPAELSSYREAGRSYMESEGFYPFSKEAFAELVATIVLEDVADATGLEAREPSGAGAPLELGADR